SARRMSSLLILLVSASMLAACGGGDGGDGAASPDPVEVEIAAGPAMLPPADDALTQGATIERITTPDDITPEVVQQRSEYSPGRVLLFGDPTLADPFDGPWVLAVLLQGSESSGLGGEFDDRGTEVGRVDVPVEQLNQEGRHAGLLYGNLDPAAAEALGEAVVVRSGDELPGSIELPSAALRSAGDEVELLVSADVDAGFLGATNAPPGAVPSVTWSRQGQDDWSRVAVSSFADTPGLELLLRAITGGAAAGPNLLPVGGEGAIDQLVVVEVIDETLVQVQAQHLPLEQVVALVERLQPVPPERWVQLRDAAFVQPPYATMVPNPRAVLDEVLGDVRIRIELGVDRVDGPFGPFDSCFDSLTMTLRSGVGVPGTGGMGSGPCPEFGRVGLTPVEGRTIVHGVLSPAASYVDVRTSGGEVRRIDAVGDEWKLYAAEVAGVGTVIEVTASAADGTVVGRMGPEPTPIGSSLALGGGDLVAPG
ncbi:MAG: hypothetical protein ACK4V6_07275, partial [Microthrixaceae bacterium]